MAKQNIAEIAGKVVNLLQPLTSDDRQRVVSAALTLLGESAVSVAEPASANASIGLGDGGATTVGRARSWMRQNQLTDEEIQQVFQISEGEAEILASDVPGNDKRQKTRNAYVLCGAANLLSKGGPNFSDKEARSLCESLGCFDAGNHARAIKDKGNLFSGSKEKGWTVTGPGLKHAASLIKTMAQ